MDSIQSPQGHDPMIERRLPHPEGFDPATQAVITYALAELEDQTRKLREVVKEMTPDDLAWQPAPGFNSVGMLLAHNAIAEFYWMSIAAAGIPVEPDGEALARRVLQVGLDDDGMPCPEGGGHPPTLAGWTVEQHFALIERARACTRDVLRGWTDASLQETYTNPRAMLTREWTLYHVVEHFIQHAGQVGLLRHLRRSMTG